MGVLLGVLFHFIGGFASGSFYLPYKKVRGWSWESAWIVGGLFSWLLVPWAAAKLTVPAFMEIIHDTPAITLFWTYLMGLLWGIGGLTFGLSMGDAIESPAWRAIVPASSLRQAFPSPVTGPWFRPHAQNAQRS